MHRSEDIEPGLAEARVYTVAEAREVDRRCVEEFGMPSILLMEHAAIGVMKVAERIAPVGPVVVAVGPGNNGGDGLAVARLLSNRGRAVCCVLAAPERIRSGSDAETNLRIAERMGIPMLRVGPAAGAAGQALDQAWGLLGSPRLVIDALLGTGLDRPATGMIAELIVELNRRRAASPELRVLAVDVPSGLEADRGCPMAGPDGVPGPTVRADATVSLMGLKAGYSALAAREFVGDCFVASIGAPRRLLAELGRGAHPSSHGDAGGGPMQGAGAHPAASGPVSCARVT